MSSIEFPSQEPPVSQPAEDNEITVTPQSDELLITDSDVQDTGNNVSKKNVILIVSLIVVILLVVGLIAAYFVLSKDGAPVVNFLEKKDNLQTFQNEYFSIEHPAGWQFKEWNYYNSLETNQEYEVALHPADSPPAKLTLEESEKSKGGVRDLSGGNGEGLYINIRDNIAPFLPGLPPKEYAKAVELSGKPSLNIVGMPAAKNIFIDNIGGRKYVVQYVCVPLYRNAEARWLFVGYRAPADEFSEQTADTVMQSLELSKEFWKTLNLEEAQNLYDQHAEELKEYNNGQFLTGEDLLKDEYIDFSIFLGLRDAI